MSNSDILREFLLETHENLALLDADLVKLEKNPTEKSTLAQVFRTLHSIKGAAGFMGLVKLQAVAHSAESLLSRLRNGEIVLNRPIATALLSVVDAIREILSGIEKDSSEGDGDYTALIAEVDRLRESTGEFTPSPPVQPKPPPLPRPSGEVSPPAKPLGLQPAPAPPVVTAPPVASLSTVELPPASVPAPTPLSTPTPVISTPAPAPTPAVALGVSPTSAPMLPTPPATTAEFRAPELPPPPAAVSPPSPPAQASPPIQAPFSTTVADSNIRVDVSLLDKLMTLMGELVLARNQILQYSSLHADEGYLSAVQRLNLLTSELQASVMKTRMQPIGNLFGKFPRIVRDLALACGKKVSLELQGQETELDKSLIESIRDPLTHMVRNSIDHGIESPETRSQRGKPEEGRLQMLAYHEGGKVIIEISDDGGGIDVDRVRDKAISAGIVTAEAVGRMSRQDILRLIFLPGFSTADRVTQFSGRGVGMDVVRTNIEKIGGTIDLDSAPGKGTTIRTKIPLTLAIIPALIVVTGGQRFAIPQVSLLELVHLDSGRAERGVEWIHGVPVYRLRGNLLPLVFLEEQLKIQTQRATEEGLHILVLQADDRSFGLVVDAIRDTEEIVVKPLQKLLKGISVFAGAAIMGDGQVALVLDVMGLAHHSNVLSGARSRSLREENSTTDLVAGEVETILLFAPRDGGQMAIPLSKVARLEEIERGEIQQLGEQQVIQYRGAILPLVDVSKELARLEGSTRRFDERRESSEELAPIVVYMLGDERLGLIVDRILDIVAESGLTKNRASRPGVLYTAIVQEKVTEFIDVAALAGQFSLPALATTT